MCVCLSVISLSVGVFYSSPPYHLKEGLSVRLEFAISTALAGQEGPGIFLSLLPISAAGIGMYHRASTWVLEVQTQVLILLQQALYSLSHLSKLIAVPSPLVFPLFPSTALFFQFLVLYLWKNLLMPIDLCCLKCF